MKMSVEQWWIYKDKKTRITRGVTCPSVNASSTNPARSSAIFKPKLSSEDYTNRVAQSESHKRCKVVLGIEQGRCWEDGQLLCERGDGVCCYTGWYLGTECNSDRTVVNSVTGHSIVLAQLLVATQPARRR
jgi:hypothetical protein